MAASMLVNQALLAASQGAAEWPEDVQIYKPLPEQMTLLDEARCCGIQAVLSLQDLKYDVVCKSNAEFMSPSGRIPFLRIDDDVVGEESILSWLHTKGFSLTSHLRDDQKLLVKSLISLFETTLAPAEQYFSWIDSENVKETMQSYGCVYPQPLKSILTRKKQAAVKATLRAIGWGSKSSEDVVEDVKSALSVAALKLKNSVFLMGDAVTEADAIFFGHLYAILRSTQKNKILLRALEAFPELVRYCVTLGKLCGFASL